VSILDLRVLGDPILRQETTPTQATDDIRKLIDDMFETMHAAKGIGLAAPQVGRRERVAVVDVLGGEQPIALINPEIVSTGAGMENSVVVRAIDRDGNPFEIEGTGLLARCLQHEIDHLNGKLFIDYLSVLKRRMALAKWSKTKDRYPGFIRRLTEEEMASHHSDEEL
jgi:peptide deformylase